MEQPNHSLRSLFDQLGLHSTDQAMAEFIDQHRPIERHVELHLADIWSPAQSAFLQQVKEDDADWSEVVDQLDVMLR